MHWATENLRHVVASPWLEIALTLVAVLCGAVVGTERERQDKPAGLRTLILVCLGSTVFTLVSFAFTTTTGDSGRVAAQIVTGIGFLGAGAILHSRTTVSGMTTAATIWIMAAIGITVGTGHAIAGLALALLVRAILIGVRRWEVRHLGGVTAIAMEVIFDPDHGKTVIHLERIRWEFHIHGRFDVQPMPNSDLLRATFKLQLPRRHVSEFLAAVVDLPAVKEVREIPFEG